MSEYDRLMKEVEQPRPVDVGQLPILGDNEDETCMLASRGETIAGVYYARTLLRDVDRFMFIQKTLRVAWAHEPLWFYEQVKYFDDPRDWIPYRKNAP